MILRLFKTSLSVISLLALPLGAVATPLEQWGTGAASATFECGANSPLFCLLLTNPVDSVEDSGLMQNSSATNIPNPNDRGSSQASAALVPGSGLSTPELKAKAISNSATGGASAGAFAVEVYTNQSGADLTGISLDLFLDDAIVTDTTPLDGGTFVQVQAFVVKVTSGLLNINDMSSLDVIFDEITAQQGILDPEIFEADLLMANPAGSLLTDNLQTTLDFDLADGSSAFFLSYMVASALRDNSSANAFGTFTASFQGTDGEGLVSASNNPSTSVPEPGILGLLALSGVVSLMLRRRKRTT
jgi:hypothetical protein